MKKAVVTSFLVFFIALTVALFSSDWWLTFINISFYIAQPLVIIGGFRFIYEKGFFDMTISSFKRLFRPLLKWMMPMNKTTIKGEQSGEHRFSSLV
ncbi:hypothetical protein LR68_00881 [Anoxybacillus sp. BCO1]|nr:hypothetical protein LR68_00881 [Anoxybacillus sp. BCO1]